MDFLIALFIGIVAFSVLEITRKKLKDGTLKKYGIVNVYEDGKTIRKLNGREEIIFLGLLGLFLGLLWLIMEVVS